MTLWDQQVIFQVLVCFQGSRCKAHLEHRHKVGQLEAQVLRNLD